MSGSSTAPPVVHTKPRNFSGVGIRIPKVGHPVYLPYETTYAAVADKAARAVEADDALTAERIKDPEYLNKKVQIQPSYGSLNGRFLPPVIVMPSAASAAHLREALGVAPASDPKVVRLTQDTPAECAVEAAAYLLALAQHVAATVDNDGEKCAVELSGDGARPTCVRFDTVEAACAFEQALLHVHLPHRGARHQAAGACYRPANSQKARGSF